MTEIKNVFFRCFVAVVIVHNLHVYNNEFRMASHVGFLNCDDGMSHGLCAVQCAQQAVHKYTHTHTQCAQMLIFSMRFDQQVHINAHGFELSK